uniref:Xylulose kinase-1 n=1 Tax=Tanacetum cinerariifolium TaxID=118510 RepID=A0A6L2MCI4_TANCI|nr:hypothetical protein [Tanacetum cinerariifolium]
MALTFADTHNMIAYLTKSYASEGFNHIIDFLNGSSIKYALTVNPNIYVSCIKQFWSSVSVKKVSDVLRLQALVDRKKVIIIEATIRDVLCLDDAEGIDCLPNEEIFTELARMGYEKPSTKLTFYKAFFLSQWKFLIHTILQCMSTKRTSWNEFSSSMASAVICLSTETPLFEGMIVAQQVGEGAAKVNVEDVSTAGVAAEGAASAADDEVPTAVDEPSIPSPPPPTQPPPPSQDIPSTSQMVKKLERRNKLKTSKLRRLKKVGTTQKVETSDDTIMDDVSKQEMIIADMDADKDLTLKYVDAVAKDVQNAKIEEITTAPSTSRRRKGVVIRDLEESAIPSTIIHIEAKPKEKGKGIIVEEPKPLKKQAQIEQDAAYAGELEAELNKNIDWDEVIDHVQRKEKEDNDVKRYQALKRKPQTEAQARKNMMIYLKNVAGFMMDYFKGMTYDDIHPIFKKKFNSNVAFLQKTKEQMDDEDSRALKG